MELRVVMSHSRAESRLTAARHGGRSKTAKQSLTGSLGIRRLASQDRAESERPFPLFPRRSYRRGGLSAKGKWNANPE